MCDPCATVTYILGTIRKCNLYLDENLERNLRNIRIPLVAMTPINAKDSNEREDEMGDTFSVTRRFHDTPEPLSPTEDSPRSIDEAVLHDATM